MDNWKPGEDWRFGSHLTTYQPKHQKKYNRESQRLFYCLQCKRVWEISCTGSMLSYSDMPTYKLERKKCRACTGEPLVRNRIRKLESDIRGRPKKEKK